MSHAYYRNYQHIVFATNGRRRFLRPPLVTTVHESIRKTCRDYGVSLIEMNGTEDHIHLLLNIPPKYAIANIVRAVKSNASILLNEQGHLFAWQPGYSAFSVSESGVVAVKAYIGGQEKHHRRRTFDDEFAALLQKHGLSAGEKSEELPPSEQDRFVPSASRPAGRG